MSIFNSLSLLPGFPRPAWPGAARQLTVLLALCSCIWTTELAVKKKHQRKTKKHLKKTPKSGSFFGGGGWCFRGFSFIKTTWDGSFIAIKHIFLFLNTNTDYFNLTILIYQCILHYKIIGSFLIFHPDFNFSGRWSQNGLPFLKKKVLKKIVLLKRVIFALKLIL